MQLSCCWPTDSPNVCICLLHLRFLVFKRDGKTKNLVRPSRWVMCIGVCGAWSSIEVDTVLCSSMWRILYPVASNDWISVTRFQSVLSTIRTLARWVIRIGRWFNTAESVECVHSVHCAQCIQWMNIFKWFDCVHQSGRQPPAHHRHNRLA